MNVGRLCKLFGKSRQAFYARQAFCNEQLHINQIVLELVSQIRRDLPGPRYKKALPAFKRAIQNAWY